MSITRRNHYVPKWYQKRFLLPTHTKLCYLDLFPDTKELPNGSTVTMNNFHWWTPQQCFYENDLYTTSFFGFVNDEVERYLFGKIDTDGFAAIRAFIDNDIVKLHKLFIKFFEYLDAQKIRTPKGLDWIKTKYSRLTQQQLMLEMQKIRQMHCTMWVEAIREIVSAEDSDIKFLITDHPITIYNPDCPPNSTYCKYPRDPAIAFKGSQTIFPLDINHCLILTNLEYAQNPLSNDLLLNRTNARHFGQTIAHIDTLIRSRKLNEKEVKTINYILKARARKYIAAAKKEWLSPEVDIQENWPQLGKVLLPPKNELHHFGGEIYVGYENGTSQYQDALGRTVGELSYLKKPERKGKIGPNEACLCGSGKKYKNCCRDKDPSNIPSTTKWSIRERNLMFYRMIINILGLTKEEKTWEDVRRELSDEQVKDIHRAFECLWPKETNIIDLLPRPDQKVLRVLYTGLVNPRTIIRNVTSYSIYFDEILVMNPFKNPTYVKPEFSPVHSPSQYKQETLKNVFLFMELIPFIELGIVNLIPDPCSLNLHLQKQIGEMAQSRLEGYKMNSEYTKSIEESFKDDFQRSIFGLPDEILKRNIKAESLNLSSKEIDDVFLYMKQKQLEDPLALLQPTISGKGEGQMLITHFSPNLELGFFLAQLTGSFMYTDNKYRWMEITSALSQVDKAEESLWEYLAKYIRSLDFIYEFNPEFNLKMRNAGKMGSIRTILRKIFMHVQSEHDPSRIIALNKTLSDELNDAQNIFKREWKRIQKKAESVGDEINFRYTGKIDCVIPSNGFGINTVHRLLLSYGSINYLKSVPMAMFIKNKE
jgi:hypothetical protein